MEPQATSFYKQYKQRVDIQPDFLSKSIKGYTKLSFSREKESVSQSVLSLNCENIQVDSVKLAGRDLDFTYLKPENYLEFASQMFSEVKGTEGYKNCARADFEHSMQGRLKVNLPPVEEERFKIEINYSCVPKAGAFFKTFVEEKLDVDYTVLYSDNQVFFKAMDDDNNKLSIFKSKEPVNAKSLAFAVLPKDIFSLEADPFNKNIVYVFNESKRPEVVSMIESKIVSTIYAFHEEFIEFDLNFNGNTFLVFFPYLHLNSGNYFEFLKNPNLYFIPEKLIYTPILPETVEFQVSNLAKLFISNFLGGFISEQTFEDFWLVSGLENWLSDCFLQRCFGQTYSKYRVYAYLSKIKKKAKQKEEKRPLYSYFYSHPVELQLDSFNYLRSALIFHIIEKQIEKKDLQKTFRNMISKRGKKPFFCTAYFVKLVKTFCGVNLKAFVKTWVEKSGEMQLFLEYSHNKKNNSIDIAIKQEPLSVKIYGESPFFNLDCVDHEYVRSAGYPLPVVDFRTVPCRFYDLNVNINIYQTNGADILKDQQTVKIESDCSYTDANFPLTAKMRRLPIKKREQEYIQELISGTGIEEFYSPEEVEQIVVSNPIMWVKADAEMNFISYTYTKNQHIIYEYIKLFKDLDPISQLDSLKAIYKSQKLEAIEILKNFIRTKCFFKAKTKAIKYLYKLIKKHKKESKFSLFIDFLEENYFEIVRDKTALDKERYFVAKKLIKTLGQYKEEDFKDFIIVGRVQNSDLHNRIIEILLRLLYSEEMRVINNFSDVFLVKTLILALSKLNLQERFALLFKRMIRLLRVDKLKKSYNEENIITCVEAFINICRRNKNILKEGGEVKEQMSELVEEINYYANCGHQGNDLKLLLEKLVILLTGKLNSVEGFRLNALCQLKKEGIEVEIDFVKLIVENYFNFERRGLICSFADENVLDKFSSVKCGEETFLKFYGEEDIYYKHKPGVIEIATSITDASIVNLIKKYQGKYPQDTFAIRNCSIATDKLADSTEYCREALNKLMSHPDSEAFRVPLTRESLGSMYDEYMKIVKSPIELNEIKNKLESGEYVALNNFTGDLGLMFRNCKMFNDKGSELHQKANQLEDYFAILIEPLKRHSLES